MRDGRPREWHSNQVLLGRLDALLDGGRHLFRLADAEADDTMSVADDDQRAEAQVLAALDDLRDAVNRNDRVLDVELACVNPFASLLLHLNLQPSLARGVSHGTNPSVIEKAAAIEYDALDALFDRPLRNRLADRFGALEVAAPHVLGEVTLELRVGRRGRHERLAVQV